MKLGARDSSLLVAQVVRLVVSIRALTNVPEQALPHRRARLASRIRRLALSCEGAGLRREARQLRECADGLHSVATPDSLIRQLERIGKRA